MKQIQEFVQSKLLKDSGQVLHFDVPLLIRLFEFCREDASSDVDLHVLLSNILNKSEGNVLTIEDYESLVKGILVSESVNPNKYYIVTNAYGNWKVDPTSYDTIKAAQDALRVKFDIPAEKTYKNRNGHYDIDGVHSVIIGSELHKNGYDQVSYSVTETAELNMQISGVQSDNTLKITINGIYYFYKPTNGMSINDFAKKVRQIATFSYGKALSWIKNNSDMVNKVVKEEFVDNRQLAQKGQIYFDVVASMKAGDDVDYYLPSNGDKFYGLIVSKTITSVNIRDYKTGTTYTYQIVK